MEIKGLRKIEKGTDTKQAHGQGCSCPSCTKKQDAIKKILENTQKPPEPNQGKQTGCPPGCNCPSCGKKADSIDKILKQVGKQKELLEKRPEAVVANQETTAMVLVRKNQTAPLAAVQSGERQTQNNGSTIQLREARESPQRERINTPKVRGEIRVETGAMDQVQSNTKEITTKETKEIPIATPIETIALKVKSHSVIINGKPAKRGETTVNLPEVHAAKVENKPNQKPKEDEKETTRKTGEERQISSAQQSQRIFPVKIEELTSRQISMVLDTMLHLEIAKNHYHHHKPKAKIEKSERTRKKNPTPKPIEEKTQERRINGQRKKEAIAEKRKKEKAYIKEKEITTAQIKKLEKQATQIIKRLEKISKEKEILKNKRTETTLSKKQKTQKAAEKAIENKMQKLDKIRREIERAKKLNRHKAIRRHIKEIKKIIDQIKRKRIILALLTKGKKTRLRKIIKNLLGALKKLLNGS